MKKFLCLVGVLSLVACGRKCEDREIIIEKEIIVEEEVIIEKEVIKEVEVEVIKEVIKEVEKIVEVPVTVIKEIEKIVEVESVIDDILLLPSRTYDPSSWDHDVESIKALLAIPDYMYTTDSDMAVGTGWASIVTDTVKICYQGNGANNADKGSRFEFVKFQELSKECHDGGSVDTRLPIITNVVRAEVNGGGVPNTIKGLVEVEVPVTVLY